MTTRPRPGGDVTPSMIGKVAGRPIPGQRLDRRMAELRDGPLGAGLPRPGTSESRQLARWLTQVILTEALCEAESAALGLAPVEGEPVDRVAAIELGSINAAAYNGSPWVRAMFQHVTAEVVPPVAWHAPVFTPPVPRLLVRHGLFGDRAEAERATADDLEPLGPVTLGSLPAAIAGPLGREPYGALVGPVLDHLGWHVATAAPEPSPEQGAAPSPERHPERATSSAPATQAGRALLEAARRRAFVRRLDELRGEKVELVPGLEHPGDPRQPDNHHKH
jgi:[acyl-carrier-protein] S-malonyltransferase